MNESRHHKGRGAVSNPASRYLSVESVPVDDGWEVDPASEMGRPKTEFFPDKTKRLITNNSSPDVPFDQSINPYKGCEHGCVYCFARPTHAYLDLSPGLDFETRIFYKTAVVERLRDELDHPGYRCRTLAMGTNTDPYQPGEKEHRVTRRVLETLLEYRHPVSIVTKGGLILRDLDLLAELAERSLVSVMISVTTLDNALKTKLEPRTASPSTRLRVVRELAAAGVPVGAMAAPVIPFVNDHELESIMAESVEAGARTVKFVLLRLPLEVKDLFLEWLQTHYPLRADHVLERIRDSRRGKAYHAEWGVRMTGEGLYADLIARRFEVAARKLGIHGVDMPAVRDDLFRPSVQQFDLF